MKEAEEFLENFGAVEQPIGPKKVKAYNLPASLIELIKNAAGVAKVSESEMARVALANGMRMHNASKQKPPKVPSRHAAINDLVSKPIEIAHTV